MRSAALALLTALLASSGCRGGRDAASTFVIATGGDAVRGRAVIEHAGCGSCHTIPGVRRAHGLVAPPLIWFAKRTFIAGEVPNTPENLIQWILQPQSIEPNTAMPMLGLSERQARDVAAYLYTLR